MNEKFNQNAKVEQLTKVVLSHGEEKAWSLKILKYRGMFETQKVRRHDKFRKEWSQHYNKCKSQMGQDQVSGGVSVLFWLAAPVANVLWKPPGIMGSRFNINLFK